MSQPLPKPAGEYFVGAGAALPEWFVAAYPLRTDERCVDYDRIVTLLPNGSAVIRRSRGAAEHV